MAVGYQSPVSLPPVPGIRLGVAAAGIKRPGRPDLTLIEVCPGASAAAVFTRNAFCAAPVLVAREHLGVAAPRYLLINTGNANAGTGDQGLLDARASCAAVAARCGCEASEVLPFSTGVIGEPLPMARLLAGLPTAQAALDEDAWLPAAAAIMTTDTLPKGASRVLEIGGRRVTITGIAKGAGMIRPDMATMLAFIATDARLDGDRARAMLGEAVQGSFNRISVDGDTSTNDACVLLATGAAGVEPDLAELPALQAALDAVCQELAQAIVRDGEGATKFVTLRIAGGADSAECLAVAYTIAHSPLVKTAWFASDPNWGRILACVGRAGLADLALARVEIWLDEVCIVRNGGRAADYTEARGQAVLDRAEFCVRVELGRGLATETVWTTDLSHDYVRINAEYRT